MKKKITIRDVAKHAGVSVATVSYVLNDVEKVSNETKNRVLKAIEELNYRPDFTAISLSKRESKIIGVMLPVIEDSKASILKNNLYYNEIIMGVEKVANKKQYDTMISGIANPEACRDWVKKRNLDGLIFLGIFTKDFYVEMSKLNIPIVLIDTYEKFTNLFNNVQVNDELGGYLATKHLIELGHKNIAFIANNLEISPVDTNRYQGYKRALQNAGLNFNDQLLIETGDVTFEHGMKAGEKILNEEQELTGIVTVADVLAIGIIKSLQQKNKRVPNDYSIVGFDDLSISQYIIPSLTTIRQDIFGKGKFAADLLIRAIESVGLEPESVEIPVELIVRKSTKKYSD